MHAIASSPGVLRRHHHIESSLTSIRIVLCAVSDACVCCCALVYLCMILGTNGFVKLTAPHRTRAQMKHASKRYNAVGVQCSTSQVASKQYLQLCSFGFCAEKRECCRCFLAQFIFSPVAHLLRLLMMNSHIPHPPHQISQMHSKMRGNNK